MNPSSDDAGPAGRLERALRVLKLAAGLVLFAAAFLPMVSVIRGVRPVQLVLALPDALASGEPLQVALWLSITSPFVFGLLLLPAGLRGDGWPGRVGRVARVAICVLVPVGGAAAAVLLGSGWWIGLPFGTESPPRVQTTACTLLLAFGSLVGVRPYVRGGTGWTETCGGLLCCEAFVLLAVLVSAPTGVLYGWYVAMGAGVVLALSALVEKELAENRESRTPPPPGGVGPEAPA